MYTINDKVILNHQELKQKIDVWKNANETIVFTNGCFDLLHLGHVQYLKEAKLLGSKLIVAANSDASVSALKGKHRPIQVEESRINILASLAYIDAVTVFSEETPLSLIEMLLPNVLVKGGDWLPSQIVGSDIVIKHGGSVHSLPFIDGYSTTAIEHKIIQQYTETI